MMWPRSWHARSATRAHWAVPGAEVLSASRGDLQRQHDLERCPSRLRLRPDLRPELTGQVQSAPAISLSPRHHLLRLIKEVIGMRCRLRIAGATRAPQEHLE